MDITQASGIVRALHAQYNTEKAAIAFLDEALTAMTEGESDFQRLQQRKAELEREVASLQEATTLGEEAHQSRVAMQQQALADFVTEANAQRAQLQAQLDAQASSLAQHGAALANQESAYHARVSSLHEEILGLAQQKAELIQQIDGLQAKMQAIRQAVAGVPA